MTQVYGSKCHICAHLDGSTHEVKESPFGVRGSPGVQGRRMGCASCLFCQTDLLSDLLAEARMDWFDPEVRQAVDDFRNGRPNPILDQLQASCRDIGDASGPRLI